MLGVCLLFVGIVLINNGVCSLAKVDKKSAAVMNILTGGLSLFINFVNLVQGNYYAAGTGLLFCFTYLFVAVMNIFDLNPLPFAWFSSFVAVKAALGAQVVNILLVEAQLLNVLHHLGQAGRDGKAALVGDGAVKHIKVADAVLQAGLKIAVGHGQLIEVAQHGQICLCFHRESLLASG